MGDELARWRQQLAREEAEDSDEEDPGAVGGDDVYQPPDNDLGLGLEEMPLPSRVPLAGLLPARAGRAPSAGRRSLGALEESPNNKFEGTEVLLHKLRVVELKLEEREIELDAARRQNGGVQPDEVNGAREAKMKELAKRAKAATMALGRERAKSSSLTAELAQVKQRDGAATGGVGGGGGQGVAAARLAEINARVIDERNGVDPEARDRELKEVKERLNAANQRVHQANISAQQSKAELQKYQRALLKEVGDDASMQKLLDEASGAKGRAQQITLLREQVKGLSKRLGSLTNGAEGSGGGDGDVPPTPMGIDGADERQRGAINAIENDRRREHERALLREQELTSELNENRKRQEANAARIRNLENDVKSKKDKLRILLEKSDSDDKLVTALRNELDKARKGGGGGSTGRGGGIDYEKRASELASRMAQQQTQIDRQEQIIHALKDQLQRQQQQSGSQQGARSRPGSGIREPQDLIRLQNENGKLRELVQLLQEKLHDAQNGEAEDEY